MNNAKIIYVISMGHSGSTLLDMLLGTIPNVFSTGEMVHLPWQLYRGVNPKDNQTLCSCGNSFSECVFWRKVVSKIDNEINVDISKAPLKFNISIHQPFHFGRKFIYALYNRGLLFLLKTKILYPFLNIFYFVHLKSIKRNWLLYDTIANVSENEFVVDSSKDIMRYWFLKKHRPNDVKLIVLLRDVHGVASSSYYNSDKNTYKKRANAWLRMYKSFLIPLLIKTEKKDYTFVKYEDYCKNPNDVRNKINKFLFSNNKELDNIECIYPKNTHLVAGNPIRHKDIIKITYDERWKERLNEDEIKYLDSIKTNLYKTYNEKNII